jgi:hypothetical protein
VLEPSQYDCQRIEGRCAHVSVTKAIKGQHKTIFLVFCGLKGARVIFQPRAIWLEGKGRIANEHWHVQKMQKFM